MRGIEKIVNQILDEGNIKKIEIEDNAKLEADKIIKEAELEGKVIGDEISKKFRDDIRNYEQIASLSAEQKKKRKILSSKQEAIESVLNEAYQNVINCEEKRYFEIIIDMLKKFSLPQKGAIIFNEKDLKRMPVDFIKEAQKIAQEKGGELSFSDEKRKIDGGFILVYGGIEENCTFKSLFEAKKEELNDIVKKELFER